MEAAKGDSIVVAQGDIERTSGDKIDTVQFLHADAAILTIIKCAIGAGSFSLPKAFMDGGVYLSFFFTVFLGILSGYTLLTLIECSLLAFEFQNVRRKIVAAENDDDLVEDVMPQITGYNYITLSDDNVANGHERKLSARKSDTLTYPEIGAIAFPEADFHFTGFKCNLAYWVITVGILLTSLGVCAAYVDFISETLPAVLMGIAGDDDLFLTRGNTPLFIMPVILGLSFLRTMKVLTYTSMIGNIAVFVGCLGVIVYGYLLYKQQITLQHNFVEWKTLPRYIGGNTFLFAIHVVILPIMQEMDNTDQNKSKRRALARSFTIITTFNAAFGFIGYLLFASSECNNVSEPYIGPCDNILSNMSGGGILDSVKILVCVDLLFTVPLILAASRVIIEKAIFETETVQQFQRKWFNQDSIRSAIGEPEIIALESEMTIIRAVNLPQTGLSPASQKYLANNENPFYTTTTNADSRIRPYTISKNESEVTVRDCIDTDIENVPAIEQRVGYFLCVDSSIFTLLVQYSVRTTLVTTVILIAVGIPQFGDMVDLVGGLVMPFTCFLLPSAMFVRLRHHIDSLLPLRNRNIPDNGYGCDGITLRYQKTRSLSRTVYAKHVLIMIFGVMTIGSTIILSSMS